MCYLTQWHVYLRTIYLYSCVYIYIYEQQDCGGKRRDNVYVSKLDTYYA